MGKVEQILVAKNAGDKLFDVDKAELEKGFGIVGDRYHKKAGTFSKSLSKSGDFEVTLIDRTEIDTFNQTMGLNYLAEDFRRNIVTADISLPSLLGGEFMIGNTRLRAIRLCEPCKYLANLLGQAVMEKMMGKCGVRAVIVKSGKVSVGDLIYSD